MKKTSKSVQWLRAISRSLPVVLVLVFSVAALAVSIRGLVENIHFSSMMALARYADRDGSVSSDALADSLPVIDEVISRDICRSDILKAGMRLTLLHIDATSRKQPTEDWTRSLDKGEALARHALSCLPGDGDVWLRLAMIRSLRVALPEETAALLTISQKLSPADANAIRGRLTFWRSLPPATLYLAKKAIENDIAVLCSPTGTTLRKEMHYECSDGS